MRNVFFNTVVRDWDKVYLPGEAYDMSDTDVSRLSRYTTSSVTQEMKAKTVEKQSWCKWCKKKKKKCKNCK